jgi:hypothetical protein
MNRFINAVSLPDDAEFPPQMDAFWAGVARPASVAAGGRLFDLGLQQRSDVEYNLGSYVGRVNDPSS